MPTNKRVVISIAVFAVLGIFVLLGLWLQSRETKPGAPRDSAAVDVTSGEDRGPGTLREALFIAAAAHGEATVSVRVARITVVTPLPPLVSTRGVRLIATQPGAQIDASQLQSGPVLDVAGANASIQGLVIRNCKASAVLLRGAHFRMQSSAVESCDVGVDVAENASEVLLEGNRFTNNRVGVRFSASNRGAIVVKNEFTEQRDAGLWAVRAEPEQGGTPLGIRENHFKNERIGILAANVLVEIERNEFLESAEAALQLMGTGAVVRGNRVSGGKRMGIIAENSRGAVIENNELDGLEAYGILLKGSAEAILRGNRVHNSGYGLAFVVGTSPSTAIDNTIIEPKFNGIDVIGDSPVLRSNQVLRPHGLALKIVDFDAGNGKRVRSQPVLEGNNFNAKGARVAANDTVAAAKSEVTR